MRYMIGFTIILLGLLLMPLNGMGDKAVGKIIAGSHAFQGGDYAMECPMAVTKAYPAADKSTDVHRQVYGAEVMSPSSMQNFIVAAAACINNIPIVPAGQIPLQ